MIEDSMLVASEEATYKHDTHMLRELYVRKSDVKHVILQTLKAMLSIT